MALSEATINFNYQKALAKAGELEAAAGKLNSSAVSDIGAIVSSIRRDWEGTNSAEYIAKCKAEQADIEGTVAQMKSVASTIRAMAKRVYDAEMRALAIAREAERRARAEAEERMKNAK